MVLTCICFQLYFLENKASAGGRTITNTDSADDSTGAALNANLVATFDQAWQPYTSNPASIEIRRLQDGSLLESFTFPTAQITGEGTTQMTINPTFGGLIVNTGWNFTTTSGGCYNPPSFIGPCFGTDDIDHLSPPDNAHFMQSYEGLAIVFGSNVTLGTGNLYIREYVGDATVSTIDVTTGALTGWGTNTLTINLPDNVLAKNTHYYVNFDIEGWSLPADKDKWDFWTKATPNTFSGTGL